MRVRMTILIALGALLTLALAPAAVGKEIGNGKGGVKLKRITSVDSPVYIEDAPGVKRLLFVVQRDGQIKVLRKSSGGKWRSRGTFLDIRGVVRSGGEEGLLSVAFPPDYASSGRFYVYYTDQAGDIAISGYRRTSSTRADPASARIVITVPHPTFPNHNGGQLQFGPDGLLYFGTGDGGSANDPDENAQNVESLLGKLIRIDPRPGNAGAYGIPGDNPFVGAPGRDEIFSTGLRNPFRFSFDPKTDNISIADVGQGEREEINYETLGVTNGANFGWDAFEGTQPFSPDGSPAPAEHEPPIHEYGHNGGNCSVTGGYLVRDRKLDSVYGRYLYADFCVGEIRSLVPRLSGARKDRSLGITKPGISTFGEGRGDKIFVASLFSGKVWQLKSK
jgi:glucose/arabinose dehydrogenase